MLGPHSAQFAHKNGKSRIVYVNENSLGLNCNLVLGNSG